ncbi:MAG: hypothetical protein SFX74_11700 [Fimbriimonadaceae bacterium]|nr:hypothetical protein [Fimbriimonadaceae bacterium]
MRVTTAVAILIATTASATAQLTVRFGNPRYVLTAPLGTLTPGTGTGVDISANGRYTLFTSTRTGFRESDIPSTNDVHVFDHTENVLRHGNRDAVGRPILVPNPVRTTLSADGNAVAFGPQRLLMNGNTIETAPLQITRLSADGSSATDGIRRYDFRTASAVAFSTVGLPSDTGTTRPVYSPDLVHCLRLETITTSFGTRNYLVHGSTTGPARAILSLNPGEGAYPVSISDEGRFITFLTNQPMTAGDYDPDFDLFRLDTLTLAISRLNLNNLYRTARSIHVSDNGRFALIAYPDGHDIADIETGIVRQNARSGPIAFSGRVSNNGRFVAGTVEANAIRYDLAASKFSYLENARVPGQTTSEPSGALSPSGEYFAGQFNNLRAPELPPNLARGTYLVHLPSRTFRMLDTRILYARSVSNDGRVVLTSSGSSSTLIVDGQATRIPTYDTYMGHDGRYVHAVLPSDQIRWYDTVAGTNGTISVPGSFQYSYVRTVAHPHQPVIFAQRLSYVSSSFDHLWELTLDGTPPRRIDVPVELRSGTWQLGQVSGDGKVQFFARYASNDTAVWRRIIATNTWLRTPYQPVNSDPVRPNYNGSYFIQPGDRYSPAQFVRASDGASVTFDAALGDYRRSASFTGQPNQLSFGHFILPFRFESAAP